MCVYFLTDYVSNSADGMADLSAVVLSLSGEPTILKHHGINTHRSEF